MTGFKKAILASSLLSMFGASAFAQTADNERYIIKYKANAKVDATRAISRSNGDIKLTSDKRRLVAAVLSPRELSALRASPEIEYVEIDPKRYLLAEDTPYGIDMVQASQLSDAQASNRKVCIVDSGYDLGHQDLPSVGITGNDGFGSNTSGNWFEDGNGHGTHVAGTIAALGGNDLGVVGVNPGNQLGLHIVKVFNANGGFTYGSDLVVAVDQCRDAGANVISMSLGGSGSSSAENAAFEAAEAAGVISIAAAGNDGNSAHSYPASYDSVMSVGAVDSNGTIAGFSQYTNQVEISAPGVGVRSTIPGNQYAFFNGTSMATPHVSGVAALVWSHYTNCTGAQIRNALIATAEDRGAAGRDNFYGHGIVKAKDAFDALAEGCDVEPPVEPPVIVVELENGVPETGLSGAGGEELNFTLDVPADSTDLSFVMSGGTGDADIYVRFGAEPTSTTYDCRPYSAGNNETCDFASPQEGTYFVQVRGFSAFTGVSLVGSYTGDNPPPNEAPTASFSFNCDELDCTFNGSGSSDSDGNIASYDWNFGDGGSATGASASHSYGADGSYSVTLTVTDDDGATDSQTQTVDVAADPVGAAIDLSVATRQTRRRNIATLTWTGATTTRVDKYINGTFSGRTRNDGLWNHRTTVGPASFSYQLCDRNSTTHCSDTVSVTFD